MDFLYQNEYLFFGSDIVDLSIEKDRSESKLIRYSKKICTELELTILSKAKDIQEFEHWLLTIWSIKESSYKAAQRKNYDRRFRYREFEVKTGFDSVEDLITGEQFSLTKFDLETAVISIAVLDSANRQLKNEPWRIVSWLDLNKESQSRAVRSQLRQILSNLANDQSIQPTVNRRTNQIGELYPPELILDNQIFWVSFSHHGNYILTTLSIKYNSTKTSILSELKLIWPTRSVVEKNEMILFLPAEF